MSVQKHLEPDSRWNLWKCSNYQDFACKFLIVGKFHSDVPEDIIKSYAIVEKLMAYSYYCYELYDEAFSKLTRIFEMAVKLRGEQIGIEYPRNRFISLKRRITDLAQITTPDLLKEWQRAKDIRNIYAHPGRHSFAGPIGKFGVFYHLINIINRVFKDINFFKEIELYYVQLLESVKMYRTGLYVLEWDNRYLIGNAVPYRALKTEGKDISLWGFTPLLNSFPQDLEGFKIDQPFMFTLHSVNVSKNKIIGVEMETGKSITIKSTDNPIDIERLNKYSNEYITASKEVIQLYENEIQNAFSRAMVQFEYDFYWE